MPNGRKGNVKGKIKLPCAYLIKHYVMITYGEVEVYTHVILTSAVIGIE
jgi:hypothetical protein